MKKTVILITGKKRSGKDTTAHLLHQLYGYVSEVQSFASTMKRIIAITLGITEEQLDYAKNNGKLKAFLKYRKLVFLNDYRSILQLFGTDAMKPEFGEDVWAVMSSRNVANSGKDVVIFADWRFPTELEVLAKQYNVVTIRVEGRGALGDAHTSETALDGFATDITIVNAGTVEELRSKVLETFYAIHASQRS